MLHATNIHGSSREREQEYLAGWQRARAELANFRRRTQEQSVAQEVRLRRQVAEPLLPLADNLRAAVLNLPAKLASDSWVQGVLHIARQLDDILAGLGLTTIGEAGTPFNPQHHEAISEAASPNHTPGTVIAVHQPGYRIGEHVVRPALVTIAR